MARTNGSLTDAQLITKARFLLQQDESWRYELALLSVLKEEVDRRALGAKAAKENYSFRREQDLLFGRMAVLQRLINHHVIDLYLVNTALVDRGLCERGQLHEFVGVWRRDD